MDRPQKVEQMLPLTHLSYQVLLALSGQDMHGYAIIKAVRNNPHYPVNPGTGTFYSAISRMQEEGLLTEIDPPGNGTGDSRRRFYSITGFGREVLKAETRRLEQLVGSAKTTLDASPGRGRS